MNKIYIGFAAALILYDDAADYDARLRDDKSADRYVDTP